jgi:hypothetical protein
MKIRSIAAADTAWKSGRESPPDAQSNIGFYGRFSKVCRHLDAVAGVARAAPESRVENRPQRGQAGLRIGFSASLQR